MAFFLPLTGLRGLLFLLGASALSVYLSGIAEAALGRKDDPRIVIDEIVGYFWTVAFMSYHSLVYPTKLLFILASFSLFRAFDVFKIPSRRVQNLTGGWGIMMDDILSGITANIILQIAFGWCIA